MNRFCGPILAWIFVLSFSVYTAIVTIREPYYNWDIIPYLATIFYFDTTDVVAAHQRTMERIQPLPNYPVLCNNHAYYTKTICADAAALRAQVNFYLVRPLYLLIVYGLYKLRVDPLLALVVVSVASGFVLSLATGYWVYVNIGWFGLILVPLVLSLSGIRVVSQLQTPDALSAVVVFFSAVLFLRSSWRASLWLSVGALLIRPDTILFLFLLVAYRLMVCERNTRDLIFLFVIVVVAFVFYGTVNHFAGHYGWGITLKHTISPSPYPAKELTTVSSLSEYLQILIFATRLQFITQPNDIKTLYALIVGLVSFFLFKKEGQYRDFSLLCVVYVALHYLIFPAFFTRFFVAHNILMYVIFLHGLAHYPFALRNARAASH